MKVLLITPPMTQINSPYPATPYLASFLRKNGYEVYQKDLGLELVLKLFSKSGLKQIQMCLQSNIQSKKISISERQDLIDFFLEAFEDYSNTIDVVMNFLQGKDPTLALRIANRNFCQRAHDFFIFESMKVSCFLILELWGFKRKRNI